MSNRGKLVTFSSKISRKFKQKCRYNRLPVVEMNCLRTLDEVARDILVMNFLAWLESNWPNPSMT